MPLTLNIHIFAKLHESLFNNLVAAVMQQREIEDRRKKEEI